MKVTVNPVCALALLLCLTFRASGEYSELRELANGSNDGRTPSNFGSCIEGKCIKRAQEVSGMWFGPRLGKRHRPDEKQLINPEMLVNSLDQPGVRWAVVAIPTNEKRQPQFIPRLGRGSEEDLFSYGDVTDRNELDDDEPMIPPIFAPRLGRRVPWIPSPRLGRQSRSVSHKM
ncbi:PBAN-type neuropeptides-like [Nylanderia fulva]|uniref:PBAN-type neuropeptides-like n=1 Tax=Nylanderia fulva TaxID=613905 RepID=UPI0010FB78CD|nr:PBAN-type neuropeptides-like [Nylanderia fulva]